jgi:hypothetical protein
MRMVLLAVACLAIVAAPSPFDPHSAKLKDGDPIRIESSAIPIPQDYKGLGALRPVAALQLTSKDVRFGGWSALEVKANGEFRLLSDRAFVLHGRLDQDSDGAIDGIEDARIGVLRDNDGEAALRKRGDSEGLARLKNGQHVVSFELEPRLQFYDFDLLGAAALPADAPKLAQVEKLSTNAELEAVTVLRDGSILTGSERGFGGGDEAVLWRVASDAKPGDAPIDPLTTIKLPDNFSLTELAAAPDGSIFALFRSYLPILGARAQIWRYRLTEENGRTRANGERIATLQTPFPDDNYEGMALVTAPDGGQRLYVISDDNYRVEQKTMLLVFDVAPAATRSAP